MAGAVEMAQQGSPLGDSNYTGDIRRSVDLVGSRYRRRSLIQVSLPTKRDPSTKRTGEATYRDLNGAELRAFAAVEDEIARLDVLNYDARIHLTHLRRDEAVMTLNLVYTRLNVLHEKLDALASGI